MHTKLPQEFFTVIRNRLAAIAIAGATVVCSAGFALADEGGVSFWLPGLYGSLAAVPQQSGWSLLTSFYLTGVSAGGDVGLARELEIRNIPAGVSATLSGSGHATGDLGLFFPSYTFATPVFGGQANLGVMGIVGNVSTNLNGTLTGTVTSPGFPPVPFTRTDSLSDSTTGFGDLYPQFTMRWNAGVNNYMTYVTGDIPVGDYDPTRLSNIGIGMAPSMPAAATPISIRRLDTSSLSSRVSLIIF